ncbi:MAG: hypothetical protein HC930_04350 [Hydrococcus sp. SU_1_0]|nr:hypothetical protein [Hydrococcus sp. SU_1_0]NJO98652.1 hypothetical protein [Pleurocapsa sp. CRU_1_2]
MDRHLPLVQIATPLTLGIENQKTTTIAIAFNSSTNIKRAIAFNIPTIFLLRNLDEAV